MAHDFRNKSFQKVLRGYAPDEVDEYIAYLNEEYHKLERRTADSERKLALALKKLDESARGGVGDPSVGPAAREAAAKLLREAETRRSEILTMAEQQANEAAERIVRDAEVQAETVVGEAVGQAEAILAEAKAQAELHRKDGQRMYDTARAMYDEIGSFRERLFGLYNEHLDAVEGITDSAEQFMESMNEQYPEGAAEEPALLPEEEMPEQDTPADVPEVTADLPEEYPEEPEESEETAEESVEEPEEAAESAEEEAVSESVEDAGICDEVASNLAFMDRLFAAAKSSAEDLYIDLAEEAEESDFAEDIGEPEEDVPEEFPAITIDWKNRSASPVGVPDEPVQDDPVPDDPDESMDFRPADGFDEAEEAYDSYEEYDDYDGGDYEENYDDYGPAAEDADGDVIPEDELPEDAEDEDDEEDEGYRAMDALFNEDKSKRDMSLTEEFNIIFADSKSSANVKEIRRQPINTPEAPKNPKKHKNF